jgi:outer membrane protein assembly factor BamB
VSVNAACSGYRPVPMFEPGELRAPVPVTGTPLSLVWRSHPLRGPSQPLATDSVNLYLGGSDRRLVAVDLASGRTRWAVRLGGPLVGGVLRDGALVYTATDQPEGRVHARRAESGSEVWHVSTGYVQTALALVGGRIIALTRNGRIYGIDRLTGQIVWKRQLATAQIPPFPLDSERVLITSYDSLYLVRSVDGAVLLRRRAPGGVTADWKRAGDLLVAATGDSLVVVIDPDSLTDRGMIRLDGPVLTPPAVIGDTLYCVTQTGTVWRVRAGPELRADRLVDLRWPAVGAPLVLGDWLLVGGADGDLRALLRSTGEEAWRLPVGRPADAAPLFLTDGDFLALSGRGDLQRLRL